MHLSAVDAKSQKWEIKPKKKLKKLLRSDVCILHPREFGLEALLMREGWMTFQ